MQVKKTLMLKNRHFISYFITTLVYVSVVALIFYVQSHILVSAKASEEKTLNMALSEFVPEVLPPVEKVEEPVKIKPVIEEEPIVEPEAVEEPNIEEELMPEPIVEKVTALPVVKKVKKKPGIKKKTKKKKITKKKVTKKRVKKKKVKKKQKSQKPAARKSKASKAAKNQFLAKIRATINKHKSYPKIAKRRRIQGSIKAKFTILSSGKVGNISLFGPKIFHASARKAVKSAFPVNAKKAPISLPQTINLTLRYQLR